MSKRKQLDTCTIPSIELSDADQAELRSIMSRGNTILITHARRLFGEKSRSGRMLREVLHKTTRHENDLAMLWGKSVAGKTGREIGAILEIPAEDLDAIYAVREVEFKLICGYMALVRKLSYRIMDNIGWNADIDDVIMEGVEGLRSAIYNYRDTDILFLTFAHTVIQRTVLRFVLKDSGLGGISDRAIKLVRRYRKAEKILGSHAIEEEIFELADFTQDEIDDVRTLVRGIVRDSDLRVNDEGLSIGEVVVDYRTGENPMSADWQEALQRAALNAIELELLMASLDGSKYGFHTEIAARYINPRTGEPYTRAGARVILKRAREKVENKMTKRQTRGAYTPAQELAEVA